MAESVYGHLEQTQVGDDIAQYVEEIAIRGFAIIPTLFSATDLVKWRKKIDSVYNKQETEFGRDALIAIQELDTCRAPLLYDFEFIQLATHTLVLSVVKRLLGDWIILSQQNGIINRPNQTHHQNSWHRDLPYQNYVISRPLAVSVLIAIDEFSEATGATHVVPFTHKLQTLPSVPYMESNRTVIAASAGSAIVFDSMLFHRAGFNKSQIIRRGVNQVYTIPLLKQQYDFPRALGQRFDLTPAIAQLLGYTSQAPINDRAWREARAARTGRSKK
jgi:ectoine hydroxylase-related dioxygenase (phytanoyl-CoA dioxygenase family)